MSNLSDTVFVSDFFLSDHQGGAEIVDNTIIEHLGVEIKRTRELINVDPNKFYILSNTFQMPGYIRGIFKIYQNYIIFEHDYKIHHSRQPNLFANNIIPVQERINYDFYRNARHVFVQSNDHLKCFIDNEVQANFINLHTSIWDSSEINLLRELNKNRTKVEIDKIAIVDYSHPAKGRDIAIEYCKSKKIEYELIPSMARDDFYKTLSKYRGLAYFPFVKESFCRLVVEAKCMGLELHTTNTYGVTSEEWFNTLSGTDMINYIEQGTEKALQELKRVIL